MNSTYKRIIMVIQNIRVILNTGYDFGNITDILKVVKMDEKGKYLNILEK
jgi:hypothetical protein